MQEPVFQQVADAQEHLGLVERLGEEILRAGGQRPVLGLGGHVSREHEHGHGIFARGQRLDLLHDVEARDVGHVEVKQDEIRPEVQEKRHRLPRVRDALDACRADQLEDTLQEADVGLLIVHDEDFRFADG